MITMLGIGDYVKKVLTNYARRYFGEDIVAISIWRPNYFDFYAPLRRRIKLAIILRGIDPDMFINLSDLNLDIQKLPDIDAQAEIFDIGEFTTRFAEGFIPETYIVEYGQFVDGIDYYSELKKSGYRCSDSAVAETVDRAFIAYGMALNEILGKNINLVLENVAYSVGYSMIALYQHIKGAVPRSIWDAADTIPAKEKDVLINILSRLTGLINKEDLAEYLENVVTGASYPDELLILLLQDDFGRDLLILPYQILGICWERIFRKKIMTIENFFYKLIRELKGLPYSRLELRGTRPIPILRIRGPIMRSFELKH